jgi:hypothetical protein
MLIFCFSTAAFTPTSKVEVIARKLIQYDRGLDCCLIELLRRHSTIIFGVFANLMIDFACGCDRLGGQREPRRPKKPFLTLSLPLTVPCRTRPSAALLGQRSRSVARRWGLGH